MAVARLHALFTADSADAPGAECTGKRPWAMDYRRARGARRLTVDDLPPPNAVSRVRNQPKLVKRPEGAQHRCRRIQVEEFARDLKNRA